MTDKEKIAKYEAKEAKRRLQVKEYFARRNVRFDVYKKFYEANASSQEKQILAQQLAQI